MSLHLHVLVSCSVHASPLNFCISSLLPLLAIYLLQIKRRQWKESLFPFFRNSLWTVFTLRFIEMAPGFSNFLCRIGEAHVACHSYNIAISIRINSLFEINDKCELVFVSPGICFSWYWKTKFSNFKHARNYFIPEFHQELEPAEKLLGDFDPPGGLTKGSPLDGSA